MKVAISLPEPLFRDAERFARRARKTRSRLYGEALAEYLARRSPDAVTEALNKVCAELKTAGADPFVDAAALRVLEKVEW